jgi:hypothetical protein
LAKVTPLASYLGGVAFDEGPVLGGFKFAIKGGLKPVYQHSRSDWGEGLLSGPAWAGVVAVISTRRAALRAWLAEGAARYVVVGALAAGLGIQASTTTSLAHNAAKAHTNPSHASGGKAKAGSGLAADILQLSQSSGDRRAKDRDDPAAAKPAILDAGGGRGQSLAVPGLGNAWTVGERVAPLRDIGMYELSGFGGLSSGAGRPRSGGSDSSEPSSPSGDSSPGQDAPEVVVVPGWQAGLPVPLLVAPPGARPIEVASAPGPDIAPSPHILRDVFRPPHGYRGGGPVDLGGASPGGGPSGSPDAAGPGGVSGPLGFPGPVSGPSGVLAGVPEPSTWTIIILGLALAGSSARQKRARA